MKQPLSRREFFKAGAALTLGAAAASLAAGCASFGRRAPQKAALPRRRLGRTNFQAGVVGIGGAGFLTDWSDEEAVAALLQEAVALGFNYFDTAPNYNNGLSEQRLGLIMGAPNRSELFLAGKIEDRSYDGALRQVEGSLRRLRTDYMDVVQFHQFPLDERENNEEALVRLAAPGGALRALERLRDEKVVRHIGITCHPRLDFGVTAIERFDLDLVLLWVNPTTDGRWAEERMIPAAQKKDMGIVAMKSFGGADYPVKLPGGGHPARLIGDGPGHASQDALLRYSLSRPIALSCPAIRNRDELLSNLAVAQRFTPMTDAEQAALIEQVNAAPPA